MYNKHFFASPNVNAFKILDQLMRLMHGFFQVFSYIFVEILK